MVGYNPEEAAIKAIDFIQDRLYVAAFLVTLRCILSHGLMCSDREGTLSKDGLQNDFTGSTEPVKVA